MTKSKTNKNCGALTTEIIKNSKQVRANKAK